MLARFFARRARAALAFGALLLFFAFFLALLSPGIAEGGEARTAEPEDDPKPRPIDPGVAPGPRILYAARPEGASFHVCSARVPLCVHSDTGREGAASLATLDAFERAWDVLGGALQIPAPDVDPRTLRYDVFLADPERDAGRDLASTHLEARDVRSRVDRGRAFTRVDRRARPGCALDAAAVSALARASLYRTAPATEDGTARAQVTALAELAVPCSLGFDADAATLFQASPGRPLSDLHPTDEAASLDDPTGAVAIPSARLFNAGAAAFWTRLDWAFGRVPGGIISASWALHPTMTPLGANRWLNEPDTFDVLRMTFKGTLSTGGTVHDLWLDFGVARAFFGSADDSFHAPELRTLGEAGKVPVDWDIPWPKTARRLAGARPVYPTGAGYLLVRRAGVRPGARLRVEIEWEEHALFRWALVKIDAAGRELGRIVIPTTERATQAQMTFVDLDGVDRVLLVGVNVGDPMYAFDPDDEIWEPHAWVATLAEE